MREGLNQYPSMLGVLELRQAIAQKIQNLYQKAYDPVSEITVTAGATQAIINAILAVVRAGDEVIVLEPCYDSYIPNIELAGGTVVRVPLTPGSFRPDFDRIGAAITPRTRAILINSPHNPSATVWSDADMLRLQEILEPTQVLLISDNKIRLVEKYALGNAAPTDGAPADNKITFQKPGIIRSVHKNRSIVCIQ
jgi:methionine aminotransferase